MDSLVAQLLTLAGILVAAILTYRASIKKQRSDDSQLMIDQHQEDIAGLRGEVGSQRVRIDKLERVARVQGDYIGDLRRHISDGRPPPPPPYPEGLIT